MKKIMAGVSLGLAGMSGMSQAHAWNGDIEAMRTLQDNTSGKVVRVKSVTTDCCTLRPMRSHGHNHQHKIVHNGQVYYCTRMADHGKHVSTHHQPVKVQSRHYRQMVVRQPARTKQHFRQQVQQSQQAINAQRAERQAMFAAKARQKAQLLAQKRKQAQMREAQKRKAVLLAQQKQRLAHQQLIQAQQRKRAAQLLQQKRKLQLLAQQRKQAAFKRAAQQRAAQQRTVVAAKPRSAIRHYQPQQHRVASVPRYESSYQRYHYQAPTATLPQVRMQQSVQQHDRQWQRSHSVRMQPIQRVVKPQHYAKPVPKPAPRPHYRYSAQQSVVRHDAVMAQRRYAPAHQSVVRHDAKQKVRMPPPSPQQARGWQRAAPVQSHGVRMQHQPRRHLAMSKQHQAADCGC